MKARKLQATYEHYLTLPEGEIRDLIEGEFYARNSPSFVHQRTLARLGFRLWDHVERHGLGELLLGPIDVVLSDANVVQPDILFISNERRHIITEHNVAGAPDFVAEVLSPKTAPRDRQLKLKQYAKFGVREYWMVDPEQESVQIPGVGGARYDEISTYTTGTVSSDVVAGFEIELREVFAK